jgi:hypothetical protein
MIRNKKAQNGMIGAIILFFIFLINWFIWLGSWISTVGEVAITSGNLTGIEAFFFSNLNFAVLIVMLLAMMSWGYFSSA